MLVLGDREPAHPRRPAASATAALRRRRAHRAAREAVACAASVIEARLPTASSRQPSCGRATTTSRATNGIEQHRGDHLRAAARYRHAPQPASRSSAQPSRCRTRSRRRRAASPARNRATPAVASSRSTTGTQSVHSSIALPSGWPLTQIVEQGRAAAAAQTRQQFGPQQPPGEQRQQAERRQYRRQVATSGRPAISEPSITEHRQRGSAATAPDRDGRRRRGAHGAAPVAASRLLRRLAGRRAGLAECAQRRSRNRARPDRASGSASAPSPLRLITTATGMFGRIDAAGARGDERRRPARTALRRASSGLRSSVPSPRPVAKRRRAVADEAHRHVARGVGDQQHARGRPARSRSPGRPGRRARAPAARPARPGPRPRRAVREAARADRRRADDARRRDRVGAALAQLAAAP